MKENVFKKFWKFYWEDNSLISYVFFIIITYFAFKYVLFPAFLFITGLSDVVAIMTPSMEHAGFEQYYYYDYFEKLNYTADEIEHFPHSNGLNVGDVILVKEKDSYEVGDVIVFYSPYYPDKLVHRLVNVENLTTKGDNNPVSYVFDQNINEILGEAFIKLPLIGLPRYWMYLLLGI
ncbi:MAG: hypothetical protein JW791_04010 [Nanoarchaeota archaeon]|nr:hypothetical protein [Nanoarchaeota archaeon]